MSQSGALTRARALRDQLVARGVPTSIEIQQGRPGTPHSRWWDKRFMSTMGHHIVSRRSMGLTPGLALVKRGRSDVPGPLCNAYLGFDGRARIICMGWANHPGAGGSYTLPGGTIPRDGARPYLFGWEIEGGITEADWPASFRIVMGKCHAATLAWLGQDERSHIEHKTWAPTRKIDRLNYTLTKARNELQPYLEDDMPTAAEVVKELLDTPLANRVTGKTTKIRDLLPFMHEDGVQVNRAVLATLGSTTTTPRQAWQRAELRSLAVLDLVQAQQPLLEAAAAHEGISVEAVQEIAAACAAAVDRLDAEAVADRLEIDVKDDDEP